MTGYRWLLRLLLPFALLRLLWRGFKNRAYWRRWNERLGFVPILDSRPTIWLHAVSVGETRAAEPLVRVLQRQYADHRILITTTTPTGSAQVERSFGPHVAHTYFPFDLPSVIARFLRRTQPRLLIVMETEWWPVLFHACRNAGIPIVVANLRLSMRAAQRYGRVPNLTRATLEQVSAFAAQTEPDAERLRELGAPSSAVHVTGSIKFEIELSPSLRATAGRLRVGLGRERPVWIAASTHAGEDEIILRVQRQLQRRFRHLALILVPRHPERFDTVAQLCRAQGFSVERRSTGAPEHTPAMQILVGDTMGELPALIAASDLAFIGGSLVPVGGHNILEAAAAGVPSLFGPHMFNFADIAARAIASGAAIQVDNEIELARTVADLLADVGHRHAMGEAGERLVAQNRGALSRTLAVVQQIYPRADTRP